MAKQATCSPPMSGMSARHCTLYAGVDQVPSALPPIAVVHRTNAIDRNRTFQTLNWQRLLALQPATAFVTMPHRAPMRPIYTQPGTFFPSSAEFLGSTCASNPSRMPLIRPRPPPPPCRVRGASTIRCHGSVRINLTPNCQLPVFCGLPPCRTRDRDRFVSLLAALIHRESPHRGRHHRRSTPLHARAPLTRRLPVAGRRGISARNRTGMAVAAFSSTPRFRFWRPADVDVF